MKTLADVKVGDWVYRYFLHFKTPMILRVTAFSVDGSEPMIFCGPWQFRKDIGTEVDRDLGWDGVNATGSIIKPTFEFDCFIEGKHYKKGEQICSET